MTERPCHCIVPSRWRNQPNNGSAACKNQLLKRFEQISTRASKTSTMGFSTRNSSPKYDRCRRGRSIHFRPHLPFSTRVRSPWSDCFMLGHVKWKQVFSNARSIAKACRSHRNGSPAWFKRCLPPCCEPNGRLPCNSFSPSIGCVCKEFLR